MRPSVCKPNDFVLTFHPYILQLEPGKTGNISALLVLRKAHPFTSTGVKIDIRTKTNILIDEVKLYAKLEAPPSIKPTKMKVLFLNFEKKNIHLCFVVFFFVCPKR